MPTIGSREVHARLLPPWRRPKWDADSCEQTGVSPAVAGIVVDEELPRSNRCFARAEHRRRVSIPRAGWDNFSCQVLPPRCVLIGSAWSRDAGGVGFGGRGIRTPGTLTGSVVFKTTAIDHSAIPPRRESRLNSCGLAGSIRNSVPRVTARVTHGSIPDHSGYARRRSLLRQIVGRPERTTPFVLHGLRFLTERPQSFRRSARCVYGDSPGPGPSQKTRTRLADITLRRARNLPDPSIRVTSYAHVLYVPTRISRWRGSCISRGQVLNDEPAGLACRAHTVAPHTVAPRRMRNTEVSR